MIGHRSTGDIVVHQLLGGGATSFGCLRQLKEAVIAFCIFNRGSSNWSPSNTTNSSTAVMGCKPVTSVCSVSLTDTTEVVSIIFGYVITSQTIDEGLTILSNTFRWE